MTSFTNFLSYITSVYVGDFSGKNASTLPNCLI